MRFASKRLGSLAVVLFGITVVAFGLIKMIPGDPAQALLGPEATAASIARLQEELGLNQPIYQQYWHWLSGVLQGNLGTSISYQEPVLELIGQRMTNTASLAVASLFVALAIGVPSGIASARGAGGVWDKIVLTASLFGNSMPVFWLGLMGIALFSVQLRILPSGGAYDILAGPSLAQYLQHLILPASALGLTSAGVVARLTRSALLEVLGQDFLRAARARGVRERTVIWKHALRSASLPIVTISGAQVGILLSGAVLTETVFAWPGLGSLMFQAIGSRDYQVVLGGLLVSAAIITVVNLIIDLSYTVLDPRMRHAS